MMKLRGTKIGNFKAVEGKDGRVRISSDIKAKRRKMSVSQRIADEANSAKKVSYGKAATAIRLTKAASPGRS